MAAPDPLAAAETYARLIEATSTLRHDVGNKLAAIKNAAFYLKRKTEKTALWSEDHRVPTFFGLIDAEMIAAENMIGKLAGPATLFERSPRPLDPITCVARAIELSRLSPEANLKLDVQNTAAGLELDADPDELTVAIRCLIENAAEASPAGGTIQVHSRVHEGNLVIDITDEGAGVPADLLATAFRPFVTGRPGRAGLGLPVALRVARKHGGSVALVEAGRGTCARMTLKLQGGA